MNPPSPKSCYLTIRSPIYIINTGVETVLHIIFMGVHVTPAHLLCFQKKSPALPTEVKKRLILTHLSSPLPTEPPHRVHQHAVPTLCGMRAAVPQTESHWGAWRWQLRLMGSHCHLLGAWPNNATCQGQKGSPGTAGTPATDWSLFYL